MATLNHDIDPRKRSTMHPESILIGKNVWIGANAAVIAAGAVLTKDVTANVIVGGCTCKNYQANRNLSGVIKKAFGFAFSCISFI